MSIRARVCADAIEAVGVDRVATLDLQRPVGRPTRRSPAGSISSEANLRFADDSHSNPTHSSWSSHAATLFHPTPVRSRLLRSLSTWTSPAKWAPSRAIVRRW